jgi:OOP family OmpA-OmpF porin
MLGTLACTEGPPPAKAPVAAAAPPPPQQVRDLDSDNDGVIDRLDRCPDTPAGQRVDSNGCPEVLLVLTGVNFKFDSSQITPDSAQILNKAVEALNKANTVDVLIVGYTDSVGSDAYNLKLSQRRANAVRDYLVGHGISADRLSTDGMGESQPVASNDTAEGRYQNRRVEFRVKGYEPMSSSSGEEGTTAGENSSIETWRQLKQTVVYPPQ